MGWNLGFFSNEVVDKVSVTLFPRIIAIPQIITSLKHPPPPTPTPLAIFSFFYPVPVIIRLSFQKIRYCIKFLVFFSTTYTQQEYCIFFSPNSCIKIALFYNTTVYKLTQSSFILMTQVLYKHLLPKI